MSHKIKGQIIVALPETSGTSKSGNAWRKREYVLQTDDKYPKKIAFSVMNDKIDQLGLRQGVTAEVSVDIESREYNGKWYTSVSAYAATIEGAGQAPQQNSAPTPGEQYAQMMPPPPSYSQPAAPAPGGDDLPF